MASLFRGEKTRYAGRVDDPRSKLIGEDQAGATLAAVVRELYPGLSWSKAREWIAAGKVKLDGQPARNATARVRASASLEVDPSARRRPAIHAEATGHDPVRLLHVDHDLVVVAKPAGLLTVEFDGDDVRDTLRAQVTKALSERLRQTQAAQARGKGKKRREFVRLGVVQRLDKDTSGVLVFPRTDAARKGLANQFRAHSIERRYVALAWGRAEPTTHETWLIDDRGDGRRGSWRGPNPPASAKRAVTHVAVEERLRGPFGEATSISCRIETGRQHQIRIHLAEAGCPLLGERVYDREHEQRPIQPGRTQLHAALLGFRHPSTGRWLRFEEPPPADFRAVLEQLRSPA